MEEADKLSNHVAFLSRGKLAAIGTPEGLKSSLNKENVTMEDVFIYYTQESLESEKSFRDIKISRKTTSRLR
jgi:ABC-2 type transport system ATP-binding protein